MPSPIIVKLDAPCLGGSAEEILVMENTGWGRAEQLARRIYQLTTTPMRSEHHPTWDPEWRQAFEEGFRAIGSGSEARMERALAEIDRLARTL
jgi:hypothetical protein